MRENTEVGFLLKNVKNPDKSIAKDVISNQFSIMTISPDGYPIDASYNLDFSIGCVFPCKTCDKEQNKCLTCLTLDDGTPLNFYKEESTCLPECPVGYRENKKNECEKCDTMCATCSVANDICDSCTPDFGYPYLDTTLGKCQASCFSGTYVNEADQTCDACVNNCQTCRSPDFCLSCKSNFFFLNDQCLAECPVTSIQFGSDQVKACQSC